MNNQRPQDLIIISVELHVRSVEPNKVLLRITTALCRIETGRELNSYLSSPVFADATLYKILDYSPDSRDQLAHSPGPLKLNHLHYQNMGFHLISTLFSYPYYGALPISM